MLADVQPDSPCLAICSLNGLGRQRPGESGAVVPVWGAGTWDAAEDEGLLQGQALDEVQEVMRGPASWHPRRAGGTWEERLQLCAPGGAGTAVPRTNLGRSPTDGGGDTRGEAAAALVLGTAGFPINAAPFEASLWTGALPHMLRARTDIPRGQGQTPTHVRGITSLQNGGLAPPSASGHRLLLFSNPPRHWRVCVRASLCHGSVLSHQKAKLSPLHYTRAQLRVLTSCRGHPHPSAFIPYRGATVCSHLHSFSQTDFCFANPARRASAGFIFFRMCLDSKALSMEADVQPKPRDSKRVGELHSHLE